MANYYQSNSQMSELQAKLDAAGIDVFCLESLAMAVLYTSTMAGRELSQRDCHMWFGFHEHGKHTTDEVVAMLVKRIKSNRTPAV